MNRPCCTKENPGFLKSAVTALVALTSLTGIAAPSAADPANAADSQAFSFGVIGDIPYGDAEIAKFPSRIQDINADSALKFVTHDAPIDVKLNKAGPSERYFLVQVVEGTQCCTSWDDSIRSHRCRFGRGGASG